MKQSGGEIIRRLIRSTLKRWLLIPSTFLPMLNFIVTRHSQGQRSVIEHVVEMKCREEINESRRPGNEAKNQHRLLLMFVCLFLCLCSWGNWRKQSRTALKLLNWMINI